jgi:hypothetical protein
MYVTSSRILRYLYEKLSEVILEGLLTSLFQAVTMTKLEECSIQKSCRVDELGPKDHVRPQTQIDLLRRKLSRSPEIAVRRSFRDILIKLVVC